MKMLLQGVRLVGKEHKTSKVGTKYDVILVADGCETMQLLLPKECSKSFDELVEYDLYDVLVTTIRFRGNVDFKLLDMFEA